MMSKTLRDDINDVVIARLHKALLAGEMVNVPDSVDQLVQRLADMIQEQPKEKRAPLVAYVGDRLDHYIREESGDAYPLLIAKLQGSPAATSLR